MGLSPADHYLALDRYRAIDSFLYEGAQMNRELTRSERLAMANSLGKPTRMDERLSQMRLDIAEVRDYAGAGSGVGGGAVYCHGQASHH
jgi:hypothetical protein